MDTTDRDASVLVCRRRYRARIEDDDLGVPRLRDSRPAALFELPFDRRPIGLRRTAAKILYVKTGHGTIVAAHPGQFRLTKTKGFLSELSLADTLSSVL
jgi:hypothetical protein